MKLIRLHLLTAALGLWTCQPILRAAQAPSQKPSVPLKKPAARQPLAAGKKAKPSGTRRAALSSPQSRSPVPPPVRLTRPLLTDPDRISASFTSTDIKEVLRILAHITGRNIVVDQTVSGPITVQLTNVTVEEALQSVLGIRGYRYRAQQGVIFVSANPLPPPPPQVQFINGLLTVQAQSAPLNELLPLIAEASGLSILPRGEVTASVNVSLFAQPPEEALRQIAAVAGLPVEKEGDVFLVGRPLPPPPPKPEPPLAPPPPLIEQQPEGKVTLRAQNMPLKEFLIHYHEATGINVLVEEPAIEPANPREPSRKPADTISVQLAGVDPVVALERVLTAHGYAFVKRDDIYLVSRPGIAPGAAGGATASARLADKPTPSLSIKVEKATSAGEPRSNGARVQGADAKGLGFRVQGSNRNSQPSTLNPPPSSPEDMVVSLDAVATPVQQVIDSLVAHTGAHVTVFAPAAGGGAVGPAPPPSPIAGTPSGGSGLGQVVSFKVEKVTVEQALREALTGTGLDVRRRERRYFIGDASNLQSPGARTLVSTVAMPLRYLEAKDAVTLLSGATVSQNVKVIPERNTLVVTGPDEAVERVRAELSVLDQPGPQVVLEAEVIDVSETATKTLGVAIAAAAGKTRFDFGMGQAVFDSTAESIRALKATVNALINEGKARVLANPRVATISGQEASIQIIEERFFRTGTITPQTIGGGGTGTGGNGAGGAGAGNQPIFTSLVPFSTLQTVQSGIILRITPTVGAAGDITAEIQPEVSGVTGTGPEGLPEVSRRTASARLRVKDGDTIVLGGLKRDEYTTALSKTPLLGDLPFLKSLFRSRSRRRLESELLILITPRILKEGRQWAGAGQGQ